MNPIEKAKEQMFYEALRSLVKRCPWKDLKQVEIVFTNKDNKTLNYTFRLDGVCKTEAQVST